MGIAQRTWQGHLYKGSQEIGYCEGTINIDRGLHVFHEIGTYDIAGRKETARNITGTLDHGYIDATSSQSFLSTATGAGLSTFNIVASTANGAINITGCSITTYDFSIPADGWITESIPFRGKTFY